jgi:AcrR family transcriptional regulator
MPARMTARERVRAEITREITDIARGHLAQHGAAGLSLRAVARDMGMVSSAVYRYFPSRDDLLTALITDGYNAIGAAAEAADRAFCRADYAGRWLAACRAARDWAVAHPHEYALIYGSPVPGYQAPADTIGPASRTGAVIGRVVSEAHAAGALKPVPAGQRGGQHGGPPGPGSLAQDAGRLRESVMPGVPDEIALAALTAWASLFGVISFELFGQFNNVVTDMPAYFDRAVSGLAALVGLPT